MSQGILQPDGTHCHRGINCRRHGATNRAAVSFAKAAAETVDRATYQLLTIPSVVDQPHLYGVEHTHDAYYSPTGGNGSDMIRDNQYEGLRIDEDEPIGLNQVLRDLYLPIPHGKLRDPHANVAIPAALLERARELGLEKHDTYEVFAENDYYGESARVYIADTDALTQLNAWVHTRQQA